MARRYVLVVSPQRGLTWIASDDPLANWTGQHSAESELVNLLHEAGIH